MNSPTESNSRTTRTKDRRLGETIVNLFDTSTLVSSAAIENAAASLDSNLPQSTEELNTVISAVQNIEHLLEFILSVASDFGFETFSSLILCTSSYTTAFTSSTASTLLERFSRTLRLPFERASEDISFIPTAHCRSIELASSVLRTLSLLEASGSLPDEQNADTTSRWGNKAREKQQQKRRRSTHTGRGPPVDTRPIVEYRAAVPTSKAEVAQLAARVVEEQLVILQDFLRAFRVETVASFFRSAYVPGILPGVVRPPLSTLTRARHESSAVTPNEEGAFPHVTPLSSATLFENAEGFGEWRIRMSTKAHKDLIRAQKEGGDRLEIILEKTRTLSNGHFTKDNHKMLTSDVSSIPIFEAKMTGDSRLVYRISVEYRREINLEVQVIDVYGVYTHAQIDRQVWDRISRDLYSRHGPEYRKRCLFRQRVSNQRGEYGVLPQQFPSMSSEEEQSNGMPSNHISSGMTQAQTEELHSILGLEKFVVLSQEYLNSILAGLKDAAHAFQLSPREQDILAHKSSCFVLGRSGTGKTTVIVFKILAAQRTWLESGYRLTMPKPRQLFISQSEVLVQNVDKYYEKLELSVKVTNLSSEEIRTMAEERALKRDAGIFDADEELEWSLDLPQRYGALQDAHFPLFITYKHLCRLLENEFRYLVDSGKIERSNADLLSILLGKRPSVSSVKNSSLQDGRRPVFLDYDIFLIAFWSHFPENLRLLLNPQLVFAEFIGVIKGSENAARSERGFLNRETYHRTAHTQYMTTEQVDATYDLFELFCKRRLQSGGIWYHDAADRSRLLLRCLDIVGTPGRPLVNIFVDEAQDNLLVDALVLRNLCPNPHGMFWAGDTAQTISAGSAFRFNELRAFMHRLNRDEEHRHLGLREDVKMFHLTTNYRSHAGIVNCADAVVQLIMRYWPESIDVLPQEVGFAPGPRPLFFSDEDPGELQRSLFRDSSSGASIEFGARQCILVRNEETKKRLREEVGDIGQILTVYQSKGLEFDDVLLYNFFQDSTVDYLPWRVILNDIPGGMAPMFDSGRHGGVCRELKHLYVAMTRARMNLWIMDCSQKSIPLRTLFSRKDLVNLHRPGDAIPQLAKISSKEEWAEQAKTLIRDKQYAEAERAFARAGLDFERRVAHAFLLRQYARRAAAAAAATASSKRSSRSAFVSAGEAFSDVSLCANKESDKQKCSRLAAGCFEDAGEDYRAAKEYEAACEHTRAAQLYRRAGKFDHAVRVVQTFDVPKEVSESIINVSRLHYLKVKDTDNARKLFNEDEEALEYMEDYGLDVSRAALLEKLGRYHEAADCHLREGDTLEAIRLFILDRHNAESNMRAMSCLLDALWLRLGFGAPDQNLHDPSLVEYLEYAEKIRFNPGPAYSADAQRELKMFSAIYEGRLGVLSDLGEAFLDIDNTAAAVLCIDLYFNTTEIQFDNMDHQEIGDCLHKFLKYARILQHLSCDMRPCSNSTIRKLFAISRTDSEELFLVPPQSYLFLKCSGEEQGTRSERGITLTRWCLEKIIKEELQDYLRKMVLEQVADLGRIRSLRPCITSAALGSCRRDKCQQFHVDRRSSEKGSTLYNRLLRVHVLQILIFNTLYATRLPFRDRMWHQRTLLRKLYEALFPPHFSIGSPHTLSPELAQEFPQARSVITVWLCDWLNRTAPSTPDSERVGMEFLTNLMRATRMAMLFDQRSASNNLHRIPCSIRMRRRDLIRYPNIYVVHDLIESVMHNTPHALNRGVLYLNHILFNRIHVDVDALCDFMDYLCGAIITAFSLSVRGTWHGLTLPKSWLVRILRDTNKVEKFPSVEKAFDYIKCMGILLNSLYSGIHAEHLQFEGSFLTSRPRIVYFIRVCRNIVFWAHNLGFTNPGLRDEVVRILSSLKSSSGHEVYQHADPYARAHDWNDLSKLVFSSFSHCEVDEVIQLHHRSYPLPPSSRPSQMQTVRRLVFSMPDDILRQCNVENIIWFSSPLHGNQTQTAAREAPASSRQGVPIGAAQMATGNVQPVTIPPTFSDTSPAAPLGYDKERHGTHEATGNDDDDDGETSESAPQVEFSPEEEKAAAKIADAYLRYSAGKAAEKDTLTEMRRRVYLSFHARLEEVRGARRSYKLLFLGPLPRLLVAVECLKDHLYAEKARVKQEILRTEGHLGLEDIQARMDTASKRFKDVYRLHKALAPVAQVHRDGDVEKVWRHAMDVQVLLESAGEGQANPFEWQQDFEIAVRCLYNYRK